MLLIRDLTICLLTALAVDPGANEPHEPQGFDQLAIEWELPGSFEQARARAMKERRLLLIKGVSFGIDKVGAVCATKGDW